MDIKRKIDRIVARNPELKDTLLSLKDEKINKLFHKIAEKNIKKIIIIGKEAESRARLFELSSVINNQYPHITEVTTVDLLDAYVDDEHPSLSTITDDVVIIKDSRAYVPNKQKSNMIMQVFEQNNQCIYYYKGTKSSYDVEHTTLTEYANDNSIPVLVLKDETTKKVHEV